MGHTWCSAVLALATIASCSAQVPDFKSTTTDVYGCNGRGVTMKWTYTGSVDVGVYVFYYEDTAAYMMHKKPGQEAVSHGQYLGRVEFVGNESMNEIGIQLLGVRPSDRGNYSLTLSGTDQKNAEAELTVLTGPTSNPGLIAGLVVISLVAVIVVVFIIKKKKIQIFQKWWRRIKEAPNTDGKIAYNLCTAAVLTMATITSCSAQVSDFRSTTADVYGCNGRGVTMKWTYTGSVDVGVYVFYYEDTAAYMMHKFPGQVAESQGLYVDRLEFVGDESVNDIGIRLLGVRPSDNGNYSLKLSELDKTNADAKLTVLTDQTVQVKVPNGTVQADQPIDVHVTYTSSPIVTADVSLKGVVRKQCASPCVFPGVTLSAGEHRLQADVTYPGNSCTLPGDANLTVISGPTFNAGLIAGIVISLVVIAVIVVVIIIKKKKTQNFQKFWRKFTEAPNTGTAPTVRLHQSEKV